MTISLEREWQETAPQYSLGSQTLIQITIHLHKCINFIGRKWTAQRSLHNMVFRSRRSTRVPLLIARDLTSFFCVLQPGKKNTKNGLQITGNDWHGVMCLDSDYLTPKRTLDYDARLRKPCNFYSNVQSHGDSIIFASIFSLQVLRSLLIFYLY